MSAFSNGGEWDIWEAHWCDRCKVDAPFRHHETGVGCSLILAAMTGDTPPEWTAPHPERPHDYQCTDFKPIKENSDVRDPQHH